MSLPVTSGQRVNLILWLSVLDLFPRFGSLSSSVQTHALSFLDAMTDLLAVRCTSKSMKTLTQGDTLWRPPLERLLNSNAEQPVQPVQPVQPSDGARTECEDPCSVDPGR